MYARVVRWEGLDSEAIRQFADMINSTDPQSGALAVHWSLATSLPDAPSARFGCCCG